MSASDTHNPPEFKHAADMEWEICQAAAAGAASASQRHRQRAGPVLFPGDRMTGDGRSVAASVIFVGGHLALAIGRVPGLNIDWASIALIAACRLP